MKRLTGIAFALSAFIVGSSIHPSCASAQETTGKGVKIANGYTKLESGLEYKIIKHGTGKRKPQINDHLELNIVVHELDTVIFSSRKMNGDKPVPLPVTAPKFKGDPMEGFMLMVAGDSAIFRLPVDSMKKMGNVQPWMKSGEEVEYNVKLVSVVSDEDFKKDNAEKEGKQKGIDEKLLKDYFAKTNIKPMKTASGLYYTITEEGTGDKIKAGQTVSVNYTGMFMDGKKFDSNVDSAFHHVQPFELEVGKGHVIKGWDEGLQLLKKGTKAVFYIPSGLAYGGTERNQIPANSILIFEVEIVDIQVPGKQAETDDRLIREYLLKNNIQAKKTESGLYYVITTKGLGPNAKPGKKVTMNYTGKLLNGKMFDSNTDPAKGHVQPFTFTLGVGQVIKGWDEGVQQLNLGSKGTFFIPSGLGYGEHGAGGDIPPNAVLVFDVEVTGID